MRKFISPRREAAARSEGEEEEEEEEDEEPVVAARASASAANRRVCKCSTRGRDAVMEEKNCLFQRPAFYRPPLSAR